MEPEKVDRMLRSYRACVGRCSHIDALIVAKNRQIERLRENLADDETHTTQVLSDMPRGTTISDPTARVAVKLASGFESDEIRDLRREVKELEEEREEKSLTIVFVNAWLQALTDRERFIVERHICGGQYWREIVPAFQKQFGEEYSQIGLKRMQKKALEKIYEVAV